MKVLVIRFSSIGDLTQALSIPSLIKTYKPEAEIHFVTRQDLSMLTKNNPNIDRVWTLDRHNGIRGLLKLISELRKENFTHLYDAHNNLRSLIMRTLLFVPKTVVRPMMRIKRFLLIRFHKNLFEKPFSGQRDLLKPLEKWGFKFFLPPAPQLFLSTGARNYAENILNQHQIKNPIVLAPSASFALKRWPLEYWHELIRKFPDQKFIVLAGPSDTFTAELSIYPNVLDLTGKTDLDQSAAIIEKAILVISNDTGLLHFAEQLGRPAIAFMGPAPFGFPSRPSTQILERPLYCRPCSKHGQGPCINPNFHECLRSISPDEVAAKVLVQIKLINVANLPL
ncbi:MAG: glycosyltransferase family 9 protein [Bdellovibrionaceae bacterium]|nr:glycosyltransferase family 9 protein [Bdellovibrio sp.]